MNMSGRYSSLDAGRRYLISATSALAILAVNPVATAGEFIGYLPYPVSMDPTDWSKDRADASSFENVGSFQGRDDVLRLGIKDPADPRGSFYNWQGYSQRTDAPSGNSFLRGDLWIMDGWQNGGEDDYVHTGMWGSAMPADLVAEGKYVDAASVFPIVHFTNQGGVGRLVVWDPSSPEAIGGWVDLPETSGVINYDSWNTIDLRLLPEDRKVQYLFNGKVIYTWDVPEPSNPDLGLPEQFFAMYLKARNTGHSQYDSYWSRLLSGTLIRSGEGIGNTDRDVQVDFGGASSGVAAVADGAQIGGSVVAEGGDAGGVLTFNGSAAIDGNLIGNNTSIQFGARSGSNITIGGNVSLENGSSTIGGTLDNPVQVKGNVSVDGASRMGGNWFIGGDLEVNGTLSPGNSIGVVTVASNHIFGGASQYEVEIDAEGNSDRTVIEGTATLSGIVHVVPLHGRNDFLLGHAYTIVEADGGFDDTTFNGAVWDFNSAFLAPNLTYGSKTVSLSIDRNGVAFSAAAKTANQFQVAEGIDSLNFGNAAHDAVALSSLEEAADAFNYLSGEVHASVQTTLIEDSRYVRNTILDRINGAFEGTSPAALAGVGPNMWMQAFTSYGQADADGNTAEADSDVSGFLIGADGAVNDNWLLGFAGGYSRTSFDVDGRSSSASVNSVHAAAYGGWSAGPLGVRFGAAHSWHDIESERRVAINGFDDFLTANYDARTAQIFGETGYRTALGGIEVEPFAGFAYVNHHTDAMHEQGGDAALDGASTSDGLGYATLGIRGSATVVASDTVLLTLRGMVGWQHAFGDVSPAARLAFTGGSTFEVAGTPIERNAAIVKVGADVDLARNLTLGASYSGRLGSDRQDHEIKANMKIAF